jgi:protein translocase SecG subunit
MIMTIIHIVVILLCVGIIAVTLTLNTKSEGLGAAITGASDSYRGAVGVEEQKRRLLYNLIVCFIVLSLIAIIVKSFFD